VRKILVLSISLFVIVLNSLETNAVEKMTDDKLSKLILGSWLVNGLPGVETYLEDGTVEVSMYDSLACQNVAFKLKARWEIKNTYLILNIIESGNKEWFPVGATTKDKIIKIEESEMVYLNEDEEKTVKIRGQICGKSKPI